MSFCSLHHFVNVNHSLCRCLSAQPYRHCPSNPTLPLLLLATTTPPSFTPPTNQPTNQPGFGAAYGTAKSGVGIMAMGVMRPELIMKSVVPVVMAGIIGGFTFWPGGGWFLGATDLYSHHYYY